MREKLSGAHSSVPFRTINISYQIQQSPACMYHKWQKITKLLVIQEQRISDEHFVENEHSIPNTSRFDFVQ